MGIGGPQVETREQTSQATPLAQDVLGMIRKQITGGTFGEGFGPLQREAGTGIRQFINSGGANITAPQLGQEFTTNFGIAGPEYGDINIPKAFQPTEGDLTELVGNLEAVQNRRTEEQAGDLREAFGAAGSRFGTSLARGEGDLRRDLETNFQAQIGQLLEQGRQFDTQAGLQAAQQGINRGLGIEGLLTQRGGQGLQAQIQNALLGQRGEELGLQQGIAQGGFDLQAQQGSISNLLQGLGMMQQFGSQNVAPGFGLAGQGILPEHLIVNEGMGSRVGAGLGGALGGAGTGAQIGSLVPGLGTGIGAGVGGLLGLFSGLL